MSEIDYEQFILGILRDFQAKYGHLEENIKPSIGWGPSQTHVFETLRSLEDRGLISIYYGVCSGCKKKCGHVGISLRG